MYGAGKLRYNVCKILSPTSIEIMMVNKTAYKEQRFNETTVEIDPMTVRMDFKDLDLIYTLKSKFELEI